MGGLEQLLLEIIFMGLTEDYMDFDFVSCDQCIFFKAHGDYLTGHMFIY